jgi:hypothetical protein
MTYQLQAIELQRIGMQASATASHKLRACALSGFPITLQIDVDLVSDRISEFQSGSLEEPPHQGLGLQK